jgi:hypothetical protein
MNVSVAGHFHCAAGTVISERGNYITALKVAAGHIHVRSAGCVTVLAKRQVIAEPDITAGHNKETIPPVTYAYARGRVNTAVNIEFAAGNLQGSILYKTWPLEIGAYRRVCT